jgi:hypothetical protein
MSIHNLFLLLLILKIVFIFIAIEYILVKYNYILKGILLILYNMINDFRRLFYNFS